jgi:uncharacterized protein (TIGR03435 family)
MESRGSTGDARVVRRLGVILLLAAPAFCQNAAPPAFDVAELKVNKSGAPNYTADFSKGGQAVARNVPLALLIAAAFHVRPEDVLGAPAWAGSERFDLIAKAPPTTPTDELRRMLVTLLEERLKLSAHTEQRRMRVYALVVAKGGPKNLAPSAAPRPLEKTCPDIDPPAPSDEAMRCTHTSMTQLAAELASMRREIEIPVVDQTGLPGWYDFQLSYTPARRLTSVDPGDRQTPMGSGVSLFNALQAQLGLKLESRKLPMPVIVVDHVERTPTED